MTVFGFIIRLDHHGVSSMIRWLSLDTASYRSLLGFFRSDSWRLPVLWQRWHEIVDAYARPVEVDGRQVMIGDGIKVSKEAKWMPGVKKLHQESDNSGKAPYIFGHHFGVLGLLVGRRSRKHFCLPLCAELHEGVDVLREIKDKKPPSVDGLPKTSITTLMANLATKRILAMENRTILTLDAYFAVGPVFKILKQASDAAGKRLVHLVTRAKSNVVAFEDPPPKTGLRGRPPKYGPKVILSRLFSQQQGQFQSDLIDIYGKSRRVRFLVKDLIWKPIGEKVRFVLVIDGHECFILMCSDLSLSAEDIIRVYCYRFKIEVTFKVLKHLMGSFCYHFWTTVWPKIEMGDQSAYLSSLEFYPRQLIAQAMHAIEGFVNIACIATGILQILSIRFQDSIWRGYQGWLKTISSEVPSEETVKLVVQHEYFYNFRKFKNTVIYRIIAAKKREPFMIKLPSAAHYQG
jgi:hypothetical protein